MPNVTVLDHPLLRHKLALLRDKNTPTAMFRQVAREISLLMAYEVTRDLPLKSIEIETPLETMQADHLAGKKLCIVSILRAGNGILEGMLDLVPSARVGHIGFLQLCSLGSRSTDHLGGVCDDGSQCAGWFHHGFQTQSVRKCFWHKNPAGLWCAGHCDEWLDQCPDRQLRFCALHMQRGQSRADIF